jgi:hypothetical protein
MHKGAAKHVTPSISPISLQCKRKLGFHSLNRCGMVGVGLEDSLEGENQIWGEKKNTFIHSNYNTVSCHFELRKGYTMSDFRGQTALAKRCWLFKNEKWAASHTP